MNTKNCEYEEECKTGLKLRYKNGAFFVENLKSFECKDENELLDLVNFGKRNRILAETKYNQLSSRSHSLLSISLEFINALNPEESIISKLQLVDLAGS